MSSWGAQGCPHPVCSPSASALCAAGSPRAAAWSPSHARCSGSCGATGPGVLQTASARPLSRGPILSPAPPLHTNNEGALDLVHRPVTAWRRPGLVSMDALRDSRKGNSEIWGDWGGFPESQQCAPGWGAWPICGAVGGQAQGQQKQVERREARSRRQARWEENTNSPSSPVGTFHAVLATPSWRTVGGTWSSSPRHREWPHG